MVDSNNGKHTGNDASKNKDKTNSDNVGKLSDGFLRLVEEDDGKGNICYCVESVSDDELLYSSISKAQAFSFCEGYRAANGEGASNPWNKSGERKPKENGDNGDNGNKSVTPPAIDPSTVKRKRMVF
jgi:hypothetical protein